MTNDDQEIPGPSDSDVPPDTHNGDEQPAYNLFLKAGDVNATGEDFMITQGFTRRKPGRFGLQIIMEVVRKRDNKVFDFAIGVGSVNHRILARRMGDEHLWHGVLNLKSQRGERAPFVAINEPAIPF